MKNTRKFDKLTA